FFSQAEDGIRDRNVTGVQTCALPILETNPATVPNIIPPQRTPIIKGIFFPNPGSTKGSVTFLICFTNIRNDSTLTIRKEMLYDVVNNIKNTMPKDISIIPLIQNCPFILTSFFNNIIRNGTVIIVIIGMSRR